MKTSIAFASVAMAMHIMATSTLPGKPLTKTDINAGRDENTPVPIKDEDESHDLASRAVQDTYEGWRGDPPPKPVALCDGPSINQTDYANAVENFVEYCENHDIRTGSLYASVVDQAVVYACSTGGFRDCSAETYLKLEKELDQSCKGKPGYMKYGGVRYGRDVAGRVVCKNFNHDTEDFVVQEGKAAWVNGMMWEEWKSGDH